MKGKESSASYNSDDNDYFWSTGLFRIEKNENLICRPSSQNFENFDFFSLKNLVLAHFWYLKCKKKNLNLPKDSEYVNILDHIKGKYGKENIEEHIFWNLSNEEDIQVLAFFRILFF